jgi:hypothetical protein
MRKNVVILACVALVLSLGLAWLGCEAGTPAPPVSPISPILPAELPESRSLSVLSSPAGRVSVINPAWEEYRGEPLGGDLELLCQLRRGGSQGVVLEQARPIAWGQVNVAFAWDVSGLAPGWYEVLCRLSAPGGETLYLIDLAGQDCVEGCGFGFVEHFKLGE